MKEKAIKNLPSSEDGPGVLCVGKNNSYIVSQNLKTQRFTLWLKTKDGLEKQATSDSPIKLYEKIDWN